MRVFSDFNFIIHILIDSMLTIVARGCFTNRINNTSRKERMEFRRDTVRNKSKPIVVFWVSRGIYPRVIRETKLLYDIISREKK
jgi:hypothetical protein